MDTFLTKHGCESESVTFVLAVIMVIMMTIMMVIVILMIIMIKHK